MKPAEMYGIFAHGNRFQVVIQRDGLQWNKTFVFSTWGGREAALKQAQLWRDEILRLHPPIPRRDKAQRLLSTNTSGTPGVYSVRRKGVVAMWIAKTHIGTDNILTKAFSVGRYGEQAKAMAIAERQKQLLLLEGYTCPHPVEEVLRTAPVEPDAAPLPPPPTSRAVRHRHDNTSGVPGVHMIRGNGEPKYWVASTRPASGKALRKSFSIAKFGDAQAKALAMEERKRQLDQAAASFLPPKCNRIAERELAARISRRGHESS